MNKKQSIPCYYHPSTLVFLDDNKAFLKELSLSVARKIPYQIFLNPFRALEYFSEFPPAKTESESTPRSINNNLELTTELSFKEVYNPSRFTEPSVLIVDYSMPGMNGKEFLQHEIVKQSPVKKILLSGIANEEIAIRMLNEGIIDQIILKHAEDVFEQLTETLSSMQQKYFLQKTSSLFNSLAEQEHFSLLDPEFSRIFFDICARINAVEYYLLDKSGSFLLLPANGHPHWLIVVSEQELNDYIAVAKRESADPSIIKLMSTGAKIPFFLTKKDMINAAGMKWEPYLYPAQKNTNAEFSYYYALVDNHPVLPLNNESIFSYEQYLAERKR